MTHEQIIQAYFAAFNAGRPDAMLKLLSDDVEHHVNQGAVRRGKPAFANFLTMMAAAYHERAEDLVVLTGQDGRMAAEFTIHGIYRQTQDGCPPAKGQEYELPVGSFFTIRDGQIARVATHYNVTDWVAQVS